MEHKPTRIVVGMMTGIEYTFFTERDETYGDVKKRLLYNLTLTPKPRLRQLVFRLGDDEHGYYRIRDSTKVPSLDLIKLQLFITDLEWTREQQIVIDNLGRNKNNSIIDMYNTESDDKMEALLWYLQSQTSVKLVWFLGKVRIQNILDVINSVRDIHIEELLFSGIGLNVDEMSEVFDMIGKMRSVHSLTIKSSDNDRNRSTYRMNDLVALLRRNTSLCHVKIMNCDVVFDGDVRTLVDEFRDVINTLESLSLNNKCQSYANAKKFIEFIKSIPNIHNYSNYEINFS